MWHFEWLLCDSTALLWLLIPSLDVFRNNSSHGHFAWILMFLWKRHWNITVTFLKYCRQQTIRNLPWSGIHLTPCSLIDCSFPNIYISFIRNLKVTVYNINIQCCVTYSSLSYAQKMQELICLLQRKWCIKWTIDLESQLLTVTTSSIERVIHK